MDHTHHRHPPDHSAHDHGAASLDHIAFQATLHCLSGCAIGEVAGLLIGTALGWTNGATIGLAVALAFLSGFALTALPFLRRGVPVASAFRIALAADAASITIMEIVDNAVMLFLPGAMNAAIDSVQFWASMALSLALAGVAAYPVNRSLIARGKGHALAQARH